MNIAVCDDEKCGLEYIKETFEKIKSDDFVEYFSDIRDFMNMVESGSIYDVVLMDIDWKNENNGIDYGKWLYKNAPKIKIIFVTGYSQQYIEAVFMERTNIEGYLSKPVDEEKLRCLLNKIRSDKRKIKNEKIILKVGRDIISLECNEIYYIEAKEHNCIIHAMDGNISVYSQLKEISKQLPTNYFQCHRSYIVNFDHVRRIEEKEITLDCDEKVFISRRNVKKIRDTFFEYMLGK